MNDPRGPEKRVRAVEVAFFRYLHQSTRCFVFWRKFFDSLPHQRHNGQPEGILSFTRGHVLTKLRKSFFAPPIVIKHCSKFRDSFPTISPLTPTPRVQETAFLIFEVIFGWVLVI